jgi:hypothetical protein
VRGHEAFQLGVQRLGVVRQLGEHWLFLPPLLRLRSIVGA